MRGMCDLVWGFSWELLQLVPMHWLTRVIRICSGLLQSGHAWFKSFHLSAQSYEISPWFGGQCGPRYWLSNPGQHSSQLLCGRSGFQSNSGLAAFPGAFPTWNTQHPVGRSFRKHGSWRSNQGHYGSQWPPSFRLSLAPPWNRILISSSVKKHYIVLNICPWTNGWPAAALTKWDGLNGSWRSSKSIHEKPLPTQCICSPTSSLQSLQTVFTDYTSSSFSWKLASLSISALFLLTYSLKISQYSVRLTMQVKML